MNRITKKIETPYTTYACDFDQEGVRAAVNGYFKEYSENMQLPDVFDAAIKRPVTKSSQNQTNTLRPISDKKSPLGGGIIVSISTPQDIEKCKDLSPEESELVFSVINEINQQLKESGMPNLFFIPKFTATPNLIKENFRLTNKKINSTDPEAHTKHCTSETIGIARDLYNEHITVLNKNSEIIEQFYSLTDQSIDFSEIQAAIEKAKQTDIPKFKDYTFFGKNRIDLKKAIDREGLTQGGKQLYDQLVELQAQRRKNDQKIKTLNDKALFHGYSGPLEFYESTVSCTALNTIENEFANRPTLHIQSCTDLEVPKTDGNFRYLRSNSSKIEALIKLKNTLSKPNFKGVLVHEISHMFANHPQDAVDLSKIDRKVIKYLCTTSSSTEARGSSLIYGGTCINELNFIEPGFTANNKKFGGAEMLTLKKYYAATESQRLRDLESGIDDIVNDIQASYCSDQREHAQRVSSQAMAGFISALLFTTLSHRVCQSGRRNKQLMLSVVSILSKMAGLAAIISQFPKSCLQSSAALVGSLIVENNSRAIEALSNLISSAGLSNSFLSLYRGQSGVAIGFAAAYGGGVFGRFCGELYNTLRSKTFNRSPAYMTAQASNRQQFELKDIIREDLINKVKSEIKSCTPEPLRQVASSIAQIDRSLGQIINDYPAFNFVYKKLLNENITIIEDRLTPSTQNQPHRPSLSESFYTSNESYFSEADHDSIDLDQAIEIEINKITKHDQLRAAEEGLTFLRNRQASQRH